MTDSLFTVQEQDTVLIVRVEHVVSSLADSAILEALEQIRTRIRTRPCAGVVVNFQQVAYFGSSMLEALRIIWNELQAGGGLLVLCELSTVGREILQVSKLDHLWPCVTDLAAARKLIAEHAPSHQPATSDLTADQRKMVEAYRIAAAGFRAALEKIPRERWPIPAPPGLWSPQQLVCHVSDFDLVFADRIKRTFAEHDPLLVPGDEEAFAARLAYDQRDLGEELALMEAIHAQVSRILATANASDFARPARHAVSGPMTLETILAKSISHIEHHRRFLEGKAGVVA